MKSIEKKHVKMRCPNRNCEYEWDYGGRFDIYATCPSCRRNVRISENRIETLQPSRLAGAEATVVPNSPTGVDVQDNE
jgi:hypothetical protein